ncbi:rhodanese-like domain-containing protein [Streptomyces sp. HSW2009]|uniref:rhodanese-like domain-containing protein n=1 Tax=Streptomyces sp. HSW2009 TaxID=3142890 RepID=UPI0032EDC94C
MTVTALTPHQAAARFGECTVIDVRTPGEYAAGHLPGAHNIPLDRLGDAAAARTEAPRRTPLLLVCASGARSAKGCDQLANHGIEASTLEGGTHAWASIGYEIERPESARATWPMDRQVRLVAGTLVLIGFVAGLAWSPAHWLSGAIGAGLLFSGVTNTCGMATLLAKLPHNRAPKSAVTFDETLRRLTA